MLALLVKDRVLVLVVLLVLQVSWGIGVDDGECGWLCWGIRTFQGMVQGWWGSMGFQVLGIWMFRGLCRSRDSREWLVGTITKMEKAYANYLWGVFSF